MKRSLKYLLSIASLNLAGCFSFHNSIYLEEKIELHNKRYTKNNTLEPDKIKIGLMFPLGTSLENFDREIENTNRLVSLVASDLTLSSPKDAARKGEIYIPQIEFEKFLDEDFSLFLRFGANYDHSNGTDEIYPFFLPFKSKVRIETEVGIITTALGVNYYPNFLRNDYFDFFLRTGLEGHYFWMEQEWNAEIFWIDIYRDDRKINGFGLTAFAGAGIEIKPWDPLELIPDDLSFSVVGEYHQTIFSVLGDDPDGLRAMLYIGIPLKN